MRFMMMVKAGENAGPPPKELLDAIDRLVVQQTQERKFLGAGGLAPTATSARVRISTGKLMVMDGPFTETKEVVGGYAILDFSSKEEAVQSAVEFMELHRKHWPGWEGETEVRQIYAPGEVEFEAGRMDLKQEPNLGK